jgi:inorganic pyrophosphatase
VLNLWRGRPGRNSCDGWVDPFAAIARARPRESEDWQGPTVPF